MTAGNLIAFEGIDGSGKSTQIQMLADKLKEKNIVPYTTMEPSSGPIGTMTRQILTGRMKADNRVIAGLFAADRLDHLLNEVNGIAKMVEEGKTVLTDRYYFSSFAYHSVDVPMDWVIDTNAQSMEILRPTVNIFIDIDADTAMERIMKNRFHQELFEKKSRLEKVRENYLIAFDRLKDCEKVVIVDGTKKPEEIAQQIWKEVKQYFEE